MKIKPKYVSLDTIILVLAGVVVLAALWASMS